MNENRKKALIFGITGMDGSHLADILLSKGYEVHGLIRKASLDNKKRIEHILDKITLHYGDLSDPSSFKRIIKEVEPSEIYNEADQDSAAVSFHNPYYNSMVTGAAVGEMLEAIKGTDVCFFQPLTSNMFGLAKESPQKETTPFCPQSPYACAKVFAYHLCGFYRRLGVKVSTAIFYNHTSFRQTEEYLLPKLVGSAYRIKKGLQDKIRLGDINAKIDIGWSPDFMEAAWLMLQQEEPDDYIIGTGKVYSIKEMLDMVGIDMKNVEVDKALLRPASTSVLAADYSKAKKMLGWEPKNKMEEIIKIMLVHQDKKE